MVEKGLQCGRMAKDTLHNNYEQSKVPCLSLVNRFQIGNVFALTAKTTLGHLWKLENRKASELYHS